MLIASDFRTKLNQILTVAETAGAPFCDVNSGDLHREVGGYPSPDHRMANCCSVMYQEMGESDSVLSAPPRGKGANLTIRYQLPRNPAPAEAAPLGSRYSKDRKAVIHDMLRIMAFELLQFIDESEGSFADRWVPAAHIKRTLELNFPAVPRDNPQYGEKGWLFGILARRLEDEGLVEYRKEGGRAFYRLRSS